MAAAFRKDLQYYKFCLYGFLKNLRFFEPFLYLFFLEKGLTFLQIGTLITVREITRNLLEIPTGILADSFGRRKTMILSFVFYIGSFLIFYFTSGFVIFIIAMLFYSFGDAFRTGTHKAMIFEYLKIRGWEEQKVHYYGHTRSASQLGSAVSSLLAAAIVFYTGNYGLIFLFTGIPYFLDLLLMISYPKELDGPAVGLDRTGIKRNFKKILGEVINSFKNSVLIKSISNVSIYSGYYQATKDYLQPVLQAIATGLALHLGMQGEKATAILVGLIYFLLYFLTSFASRNSGKLADFFRNLRTPLNISLVTGLVIGAVAGLCSTGSATIVVILSIVLFIGIYITENIRKPIGIGYITELLNKDILATVLSTESQIKSLYAALLAPLLGFFADKYGIGIAMIIISSLVLVIVPLILIREGRKVKNTGA
ncbi:MAG: MFS transporter [Bacteroidales bacterium]|nr:MAG: MFS transporter [Bacteroidales bacterium]